MRGRPALRQQQRFVLPCVSAQGKSTHGVAGKDNQRMQRDQIPPLQDDLDSEFSFGGIGRLILFAHIHPPTIRPFLVGMQVGLLFLGNKRNYWHDVRFDY